MAHKAPKKLVIRDWGRRKGSIRYQDWKRRIMFALGNIRSEVSENSLYDADEIKMYEYTRLIELGIPFDEVMLEEYKVLHRRFCIGEPAAD